ncbi:MAG TPA: hypothetical protein VJK03_00750 [Candidatus Nanoarchaeia archaeon]|nr:hypothetical protein [Candidatus Nanoarchaeia archaeon]
MAQKSFFRKRTPQEMVKSLEVQRSFSQRGLIEKLWSLNAETQAIELRSPLIPQKFLGRNTNAQASRKDYKHGDLISIDQPESRAEAYEYPYIPLTARMKAFDNVFRGKREEEIDYIGITWQPIQGNDRRWRVVPFDIVIEGVKLYNYAVHHAGGINVVEKYTRAGAVQREGGHVLCRVPSRTKGRERYDVNLVHVPILHGKETNAIVLSLRSQYGAGEPERMTFLHHLRYENAKGPKTSDIFVFGPHELAAYLAVIRNYWHGLENTVPLTMNPFPLPSRAWAKFGDKLDNNVMIYDPTLAGKDKLRNLHLDEKCIILARSIAVKGPYETAFWDPRRDGHIKDYWK